MVDCKLDLNAILTDNCAGGGPALLFVNVFYHQPFVTSVTKTSKAGLLLFLSAKGYLGISKSETDPKNSPQWRGLCASGIRAGRICEQAEIPACKNVALRGGEMVADAQGNGRGHETAP